MVVVVLQAFHYPDPPSQPGTPRFGWHSVFTRSPKWEDIESAILRLDRDEWPFIWLHTEEPTEDRITNNMFCVMGGRGEYDLWLDRDGDDIRYLDATRSDEGIRIWESDQGLWASYRNLCNDLSLVLEITRRFAETGELYQSVTWEKG